MNRWLFSLWSLAVGAWVGTVAFGFIAAFAIFELVGNVLPDSASAGSIAGALFAPQMVLGIVVLGAAIPLAALHQRAGRFRRMGWLIVVLLTVALACTLLEMFWITPTVRDIRIELGQEFGSVYEAPTDHPLRRRFGMMHGVSAMRAMAELVCGVVAFVLATAYNRFGDDA
jgi:hypothetical protein